MASQKVSHVTPCISHRAPNYYKKKLVASFTIIDTFVAFPHLADIILSVPFPMFHGNA
jgi:hypothetical protein